MPWDLVDASVLTARRRFGWVKRGSTLSWRVEGYHNRNHASPRWTAAWHLCQRPYRWKAEGRHKPCFRVLARRAQPLATEETLRGQTFAAAHWRSSALSRDVGSVGGEAFACSPVRSFPSRPTVTWSMRGQDIMFQPAARLDRRYIQAFAI